MLVFTASNVQIGFSGQTVGLLTSQKLSSVHELVSHKHVLPVVPVFCVTPSLFVHADVAGSHVPSALQISCALHVDPLLQRHSARFAVPALFAQAAGAGVETSEQVPASHNCPAVHSEPVLVHWQASVFAAEASVIRHIFAAGQ
jgi:hypothetical protein